jgi:hypothetical protein
MGRWHFVKRPILHGFSYTLFFVLALTGAAQAASPNGTTIPNATQIVNAKGNVFTLAGGTVYRNGKALASSGITVLLYYNSKIYAGDSFGDWWQWTGSAWRQTAGNPQSPSASGTTIPDAPEIVDGNRTVWTVGNNGNSFENGVADGGANITLLLYYNGIIYAETSDPSWWEHASSGWFQIAGDPRGGGRPPPPSAGGCQLGNHGPVRGWAQVANGTLLADDGCLLRGGAPYADVTLGYLQFMHDTDHFNYIRYPGWIGGWYGDPNYDVRSLQDNITYIDAVLAYAKQTGMYVDIVYISGPCDTSWGLVNQFWQTVAPRYANETNVIYELKNEPDYCESDMSQLANDEATTYQLVRSLSPNTPIIAWSFISLLDPDNNGAGLVNTLSQASQIDYSNAVVGFHPYGSPVDQVSAAITEAEQAGYPVMHTEYTPCTDWYWPSLVSMLESRGVSWNCGDDPMGAIAITWPED